MTATIRAAIAAIAARLAPAAKPASPPAPDARLQAIDKIRATARWLIVAFAAVGAALAGSAPLSKLSHVAGSDHRRLAVAGVAALIGLAAITFAIWATTNVLLPATRDMPRLVNDPKVRAIFDTNFELLNGHGRTLTEFQQNFDEARAAYVDAATTARASVGTRTATKETETKAAFYAFTPTVDRIMNEGLLITVTERFIRARKIMVVSAFVAGVSIVAFTWAANPPSATSKPKAGADQLAAVSDGVGVEIARADAIALLTAKGIHNARAVVGSFTGGLEIRTVGTGDHFLRYTTKANDAGSYLTRLSFHGPTTARLALHLPFADTAACIQSVKAIKPTLVLEGDVAQGRPGALQLFTIHPDDFYSVSSASYGSSAQPCPS